METGPLCFQLLRRKYAVMGTLVRMAIAKPHDGEPAMVGNGVKVTLSVQAQG